MSLRTKCRVKDCLKGATALVEVELWMGIKALVELCEEHKKALSDNKTLET